MENYTIIHIIDIDFNNGIQTVDVLISGKKDTLDILGIFDMIKANK
jgi:hypothetical protein